MSYPLIRGVTTKHTGKGSRRLEEVVHKDCIVALQQYRDGNKNAYNEMMQRRTALNLQGKVYWCTDWDWIFTRIAKKETERYLKVKQYPKGKQGGSDV